MQKVHAAVPNENLDQQFYNLIHDNNVVIVGPAAYLEGSKYGNSIEEKDIVVRINRSYETCERIPEDVGNRTDILYSCLLETNRNAGILDFGKIRSKMDGFLNVKRRKLTDMELTKFRLYKINVRYGQKMVYSTNLIFYL